MTQRDPEVLSGWKEIGDFCGGWSVKKSQRIAKAHSDFPVRRVDATGRSSVFAYKSELRVWLRTHSEGGNRQDQAFPTPEEPISQGVTTTPDPANDPAQSPESPKDGQIEKATQGVAFAPQLDHTEGRDPSMRKISGRRWWIAGLIGIGLVGTVIGIFQLRAPSVVLGTRDSLTVRQGHTVNLTVAGVTRGHSVFRWTKTPNGVDSVAKNQPIKTDSIGGANLQFSPACAAPIGQHLMWVEEDKTGRRSNEVTLTVTTEPRCLYPVPDLVAGPLTVSAESVPIGSVLHVTLGIRNDGTAPSPEFRSRIRLSPMQRTSMRDTSLLTFATSPIQPGGSVIRTFDVRIALDTTPGAYFVTAYVDNFGDVLEADNDNNSASSERQIIVVSR